jgi:hypothetical protein
MPNYTVTVTRTRVAIATFEVKAEDPDLAEEKVRENLQPPVKMDETPETAARKQRSAARYWTNGHTDGSGDKEDYEYETEEDGALTGTDPPTATKREIHDAQRREEQNEGE